MFKDNKKIQFFAKKHFIEGFPHPQIATKFMPEYVAQLKPQVEAHPSTSTVKRCVPFIDAIGMGYIIPMWSDVFVRASNGSISIDFPKGLQQEGNLGHHSFAQIKNHPLSHTLYGKLPMKWTNPWGIKTPKGWSVLITSPLNHLETRFKVLDGVVDTDEYYSQINFPFIWTGGDGEFFIQRGTPLVQVIPFQRTKLKSEIVEQDDQKNLEFVSKLGSVFRHAYRNMVWHNRPNRER